jgi:hypothetical protein
MWHTSHPDRSLIAQARETLPVNEMLFIVVREVIVENGDCRRASRYSRIQSGSFTFYRAHLISDAREAWCHILSAYSPLSYWRWKSRKGFKSQGSNRMMAGARLTKNSL